MRIRTSAKTFLTASVRSNVTGARTSLELHSQKNRIPLSTNIIIKTICRYKSYCAILLLQRREKCDLQQIQSAPGQMRMFGVRVSPSTACMLIFRWLCWYCQSTLFISPVTLFDLDRPTFVFIFLCSFRSLLSPLCPYRIRMRKTLWKSCQKHLTW